MDNLLYLILGLILGIPFSIFANFATPWVKSHFEKRKLTTKERKIYVLLTGYSKAKKLSQNFVYLNLHIFQILMNGIITVILLFGIFSAAFAAFVLQQSGFSLIVLGVLALATLTIPFYYSNEMAHTRDALNFDNYREQTIDKLQKLGGNPEDLDKEETAKRGGQNGME